MSWFQKVSFPPPFIKNRTYNGFLTVTNRFIPEQAYQG
jgi:hypothetical protein